jgi:hypothetical protein
MKHLPILIVLLCGYATSQTPDPTPIDARISGTVLNEHDKPVAGALVFVLEDSSSFVDWARIETRCDSAGRFDFGQKLKHGIYQLYARKESDGYPDLASRFYEPLNFQPQTVQLFGNHPAEKTTIKLEGKAAVLTGRVFDGDTGQTIKAGIYLSNLRTDTGQRLELDSKGNFRGLIPAKTDVYVMVQEGDRDQEDWSIFTTTVNLEPGQTKRIEVSLFKAPVRSDDSQ